MQFEGDATQFIHPLLRLREPNFRRLEAIRLSFASVLLTLPRHVLLPESLQLVIRQLLGGPFP